MSTTPDCPSCLSHDIRPLNATAIGVSGYRCHDCAKIFYVASVDVTNDIQDAQARLDQPAATEQPLRRAV
jgi:transposase-like protein